MDYTGKYGVGPNTFYIPFNTHSQGKNLNAFLKSEHYKTLALACKTSRQFLKIGFIEHLNLSKILNKEFITKTLSNKKTSKKTNKNNKTRKHIKKDNVNSI